MVEERVKNGALRGWIEAPTLGIDQARTGKFIYKKV